MSCGCPGVFVTEQRSYTEYYCKASSSCGSGKMKWKNTATDCHDYITGDEITYYCNHKSTGNCC